MDMAFNRHLPLQQHCLRGGEGLKLLLEGNVSSGSAL